MRFGRRPRMWSVEAQDESNRRIERQRMDAFQDEFPGRHAWICANFKDALAVECRLAIVNLQPLTEAQCRQLDVRCLADFF